MAAARPPGVSDARVPCPLCGGLLHPVAGRCKHCKQDLTALRGARPQASAPLPALDGKSAPVALPVTPPAEGPILPPRPTGRSPTVIPPPSMWRSWPVLVIVVSSLALVAAIVFMMWPYSSEASKKHVLEPPPAPERMETNPLPAQPPPPGQNPPDVDPWGPPAAQRHGAADPPPRHSVDPFADPDPASPAIDDNDPFSIPHPNLSSPNALRLANAIGKHLCDKLTQCTGNPTMSSALCGAYGQGNITAPTCPAAQRCIQHIDALTCSDATDAASSWELMQKLHDCVEAINC